MGALQKVVTKFLDERANFIRALENCPASNMEDYWRWQGHAQARRMLSEDLEREGIDLSDDTDPEAIKAEALRDAARAQREIARNSRTRDGAAEAENLADWLDERANLIALQVEGAHP
ncbi:MAG TPA: hypothetical protein VGH54_09720 [Mycobacterium sp.]|jgi:hypothetical protein|uniref:hypothetical protein n=1 Tax=Mycobacterium sp. TaxID=1785 RepID=UPI002F401BC8